MKTLTLAFGGSDRPPLTELRRRELADECPRITYYETQLNSEMLDDRYLASVRPALRPVYKRLPSGMGQAVEAFRRRREYDAVVSWGEGCGLPLAGLLKARGASTPHVGLFSWISRPKKAAVVARVHSHIHRVVVWSSAQYEFAVNQLGIPASRVVQLRWLVDQRFWRPADAPTDMICAVGREMRDYPTLVEAIRDLPIPCHIAAKLEARKADRWRTDLSEPQALPSQITLGPKSYLDLRALYARSRVVVIPLYPSDTDNGVTVMTEAMAMGKAVICTRVAGQRDLLEHGVNGLFVPPGDPRAMREAIEYLWSRPEECERLGRAGRACVERSHTLEQFVGGVRSAVADAITEVRESTCRSSRAAPEGS